MKRLLLATVAALALTVPAIADPVTVSGNLTSDHCTGGCGPQTGGFGTVTVVDNGLGAGANNFQVGTLAFTVNLINGNNFVSGGQDVTFGFDLTSNITLTYTGVDLTLPVPIWAVVFGTGASNLTQARGTLHADGFGDVEYGLKLGGSGNSCASTGCPQSLTFSISGTGLDWTDLAEFSTGGSPNAVMVADIFSGTTSNTGFVDLTTSLTTVPVPGPIVGAGLPGLLAAMFGLFGLNKYRRRRTSIAAVA